MLALQAAVLVLLGVALAPSLQSPIDSEHEFPPLPDIVKNRFKNHRQVVQLPPGSIHSLKAVQELWLEQRLDHFNASDTRTWQQRYYVRRDHFYGGTYPVFIHIGGEGEEFASRLADSVLYMTELAKNFGAITFNLEHRFYGASHPFPDMTTANLKYLSADQALEDLVFFIQYLKDRGDIIEAQPIVVFGGSYPGNLAAWARYKYPELILAAIASSAPVEAKVDLQEYMQITGWGLVRNAGQWCYDNVKKATDRIVELVQTPTGQQQVRDVFRIWSNFDFTSKADLNHILQNLSLKFMQAVQYNDDSQPDSEKNIKHICSQMSGDLTPDEAMAKLAHLTLGSNDRDGVVLDWTYSRYIQSLQNTAYSKDANGDYKMDRQWWYQVCSQVGFFQTYTSGNTPFPKDYNNLDFNIQTCEDTFGTSFGLDEISAAVNRTNSVFGGRTPDASNILFVNGDLDPWIAQSVVQDLSSASPAFTIEGGSHCQDMLAANAETDSAAMTTAHLKVYQFLQSLIWV